MTIARRKKQIPLQDLSQAIITSTDGKSTHAVLENKASLGQVTFYNYKMIVAYDGTDYHGWQQQQHCSSIAQTLQDYFKRIFNRSITVIGASRTDAGVHAAGQVVLFTTDLRIDLSAMEKAWNNILPPAILIRSISRVDDTFFPQRNVRQKIYHYHFFLERPLPFAARYGWYYRYPVSLEKLRDCLQAFVGTHDFRSFCTLEDKSKNTIRTIDSITVEYLPKFKVFRISVRGYSFLHYMIRRIVGAALEVASRDYLDRSVLEKALAEKNPQQSLPKAPAHGLLLYKIFYHEEDKEGMLAKKDDYEI